MTSKQRRASAVAPSIKALIASASLVATIGGWAAFSNDNANSDQTTPTQAVVVAQAAETNYNLTPLQLNPLPTLVPTINIPISVPTATQQSTQGSQTASSAAQTTATAAQPTAIPVPPTAAPVPTDTPVTAVQRPRAVTTTRSSRSR